MNYLPSSLGFTNCIFILDFVILLDNTFWWFVTSIKAHQFKCGTRLSLMNMNLRIYLFMNPPITWSAFASKSVCTTVAWVTHRWGRKFVDEARSTVFHRSSGSVPAAVYIITKAYLPGNFTIFHWRMSTIQPTWEVCTTSECWHTHCWHFCSCSSHKTIPSIKEFSVAEFCMDGCFVTALSIGIT